jgi:hypothetical protein
VTLSSVSAISAMVAPVVLITTGALLSNVRRHQLTRNAVLLIYAGIGVLVVSVIDIALAVTRHSETFGRSALALVLAGTIVMLLGLVVAARSMAKSADAITYAVDRTGTARTRR